ncbi:tRNA uracil 4-sulfurtransferase ThiI [Pelagibaculum spongiae]|uniref:tRNA sulfurtransferase n=1 Tax=Pelagibaculum spongiae TaxID=2080658 RepID=A0A2V1H2M5_9GAMM|nr:tRNA uracil 4-sulfurtransferase ThiI [Pelagibaculum spongiae]PVZ69547.1 tRNA 4-thiouridine(8) synthase ThiI [Pelagibaculum spongiae]
MKYLIKLFPEITIKSKPVRKRFIQQLKSNLNVQLKRIDPEIKVSGNWDRLDVDGVVEQHQEAAEQVLSCTPGIGSFLRVFPHDFETIDDILQLALPHYTEVLKGKTFCLRVKRTGNHHAFSSIDVERQVGGGLNQLTEAVGVKLKKPDITIKMEIVGQQCFMVQQQQPGLGGFPLGTQDAVLSLISGGFDSGVASYLVNRRGLQTHFCFFNLGGRAHEVGVKQVSHQLWEKYSSSHRVKFVSVPFEGVVAEILTRVENSQMGVILKRMMYRAANKIADRLKLDCIVTGESVAQVSSQTLANLNVIERVSEKLVLRPLVTMDKPEIIDISRQIGTHDMASQMPEYCGVISKKPTTRARLPKIEAEEERFDFAVLDKAIEDAVVQSIDNVLKDIEEQPEVEVKQKALAGSVIVDIRHPDEIETKSFASLVSEPGQGELLGVELLEIPFFNIQNKVTEFDPAKQYLFYCEKGVMSQLHALHLKEQGHENVHVFRPQS